jgi:hypothetical protein
MLITSMLILKIGFWEVCFRVAGYFRFELNTTTFCGKNIYVNFRA